MWPAFQFEKDAEQTRVILIHENQHIKGWGLMFKEVPKNNFNRGRLLQVKGLQHVTTDWAMELHTYVAIKERRKGYGKRIVKQANKITKCMSAPNRRKQYELQVVRYDAV